jgi:hypothetical protein
MKRTVSWILVGALCATSAMTGPRAADNREKENAPEDVRSKQKLTNVRVVNSPNVHVANTPSVTIANTVPVPVQPAFPMGFQPFIRNVELAATNGSWGGQAAPLTVPAGKMLVIEHVSARIDLPNGQSIGSFALLTQSLSGSGGLFFIAPQPQAIQANTGASVFVANSALRLYVTPQSTVQFGFDRSSPDRDSTYGYVTISGYVVDSPVPAN